MNASKKQSPAAPGPNNANSPASTPAPNQSAVANYTLPGVISYLTSEFTNLERFKIITNLEKSEMKYQIQQLTSELNSVRYLNEKQAVKIRELEAELGRKSADNNVHASLENLVISDSAPQSSSEKTEEIPELTGPKDIPYIDLDTVRDARQTLNESIREVIDLLRPPSSAMDTDLRPSESAFADLLETADSFSFDASPEKPHGLFERYTLKSEDVLADQKAGCGDGFEEDPPLAADLEAVDNAQESDAETVIADEIASLP